MPIRTKILDVSERRAFRTIYEAINWCVGTNYRYWGRGCWPNYCPTDGFRMWFTQLAYVEHGRYVPAVNNCLNMLCCDGNYHVYDKIGPIEYEDKSKHNWKYDLIFSKEIGGHYYFRGVFVGDSEHSAPNHHVSKRIATKVKLIGCPARRLELLDSVNPGKFDVDYLKKQIVSFDVVDISPRSASSTNYNVVQNKPTSKFTSVAPVVISDEECAKLYPVNCQIIHKSFGKGTVKRIEEGIITIVFDKDGKKILAQTSASRTS